MHACSLGHLTDVRSGQQHNSMDPGTPATDAGLSRFQQSASGRRVLRDLMQAVSIFALHASMLPFTSNVTYGRALVTSSLLTSAALRSSRSAGVHKFSQVGFTSTSAAASLIRRCSCAGLGHVWYTMTLHYPVAVTCDTKRAYTWNTHVCQTCVMNHPGAAQFEQSNTPIIQVQCLSWLSTSVCAAPKPPRGGLSCTP
ncbi:hypothetical protein OH76DRAFT_1085590 [Lentinus brumalis]|uniref:Uncharacterized protein n=1 Tax=Lentinus brumalis TaxID=2498619 RepID=A0A371DP77_9APHY|nr:hypothetical protein OH76DRAFT_1085590 [Polyporus brumalis]